MTDIVHFEGTCNVCGAALSLDHDFNSVLIDYGYDKDNRLHTWIRHYATAPPDANPDCAKYFSTVYAVEQQENNNK